MGKEVFMEFFGLKPLMLTYLVKNFRGIFFRRILRQYMQKIFQLKHYIVFKLNRSGLIVFNFSK